MLHSEFCDKIIIFTKTALAGQQGSYILHASGPDQPSPAQNGLDQIQDLSLLS